MITGLSETITNYSPAYVKTEPYHYLSINMENSMRYLDCITEYRAKFPKMNFSWAIFLRAKTRAISGRMLEKEEGMLNTLVLSIQRIQHI